MRERNEISKTREEGEITKIRGKSNNKLSTDWIVNAAIYSRTTWNMASQALM